MTTQTLCWKRNQGPCYGPVVRYRPFKSSGDFDYCQRHIEMDKQVEARAGTPGWCYCGRPVISMEIVAYRKGLGYPLSPRSCIIHQPKPMSDAEREARERYQSEKDQREIARDFEYDTGYNPGGWL